MAQGRRSGQSVTIISDRPITARMWDALTEFILLVEKHDISYAKCDNTGRYSNFYQQDDIHEEILRHLTSGLVTREDYIRVWNSKVRRSGVDRSYLLAEDWNK